ncbi:hypothetical protein FOA52_016184 [Chlamydomonas sp. UWO 241]|nr:hypothetical protein FOA52_016184 [Chlamydomonas sp. UWO 241]
MCGKYMEALVKCREDHSLLVRYTGVCSQITYDLSNCLTKEKKEARAPRQAQYQEAWRAKRLVDAERLRQMDEALAARAAASASADASAVGEGSS